MAWMRMFTGIPLSDAAREKILKELKPFKKAGTPIRWTTEPNIHLTLKFIGEVDEPLAEKVAEALQREKPAVPPFCLRLRGFGKFPSGDDLHVFWAGVEESPELRALFAAVEAALMPLGIARDARPFRPHLTLGRNKAPRSWETGTSGPTGLFQPSSRGGAAPSSRGGAAPSLRGGAAPSLRGGAARYNFKELLALLGEWSDRFLAECPVSAFRLFSSRLTPEGPVYTIVKEIDLVQS